MVLMVVPGLPWVNRIGDTLEMITHKQPDILADFRAADLGFGVAIAVNQDTEQEDAGNRPGQHQHPVQVKLPRPQNCMTE